MKKETKYQNKMKIDLFILWSIVIFTISLLFSQFIQPNSQPMLFFAIGLAFFIPLEAIWIVFVLYMTKCEEQ